MALHDWRAVKNVAFPKRWGIETTDPTALEAGNEMILTPEHLSEVSAKAIVEAHNAAIREAVAQVEILSNPVAVHISMVRGVIAKPSWENLRHLYPRIYDLEAALRDILGMLRAREVYTREYIAQTVQALLDYRGRAPTVAPHHEGTP